MTRYKGHVENGAIVLDGGTYLPEGTPVEVLVEISLSKPSGNSSAWEESLHPEVRALRQLAQLPRELDAKKEYRRHLRENQR